MICGTRVIFQFSPTCCFCAFASCFVAFVAVTTLRLPKPISSGERVRLHHTCSHMSTSATCQHRDDVERSSVVKPPNCSGKEHEWSEWSFVVKSYVSVVHTPSTRFVGRCRRRSDELGHEFDDRQSHSQKMTRPRPRNPSTPW